MRRGLLAISALQFLVMACGADHAAAPTEVGASDAGDAGTVDAGDAGCRTQIPICQGLSQPCCKDYEIDACGPGLFCAAFDGRRQTACYPEHSREDGSECEEDRDCVHNSCNLEKRKCRVLPTAATCDPEVGCADDAEGKRYVCDGAAKPVKCVPVGDGLELSVCGTQGDCRGKLVCEAWRCKIPVGGSCSSTEECVEHASCEDCDVPKVHCADDWYKYLGHCMLLCPDGEWWPECP